MTPQNMVHSAEVRWLFPGEWNDAVRNWFLDAEKADAPKKSPIAALDEGERVDKYLLFPACSTVGVKMRGGKKFEIKSLVVAPHPFDCELGSGRTDHWVKWSFENDDLKPLEDALYASGAWITLNKRRYVRKFSAGGPTLEEVWADLPKDELPESGCNIELTLIQILEGAPSQTWFSLGFEAFGPAARVSAILDQTLSHFFQIFGAFPGARPDTRLNARDCFSYPEWLATLK